MRRDFFGCLMRDESRAGPLLSIVIPTRNRTPYAMSAIRSIHGASKASGAIVEGVVKKQSTNLLDAPHLRHRGEYHWCELVPSITVETLWVDSSIAALRAEGGGGAAGADHEGIAGGAGPRVGRAA